MSELLEILRKHNVALYRTPELELHLAPVPAEIPDLSLKDREAREAEEDERIMFAHVAGN